MDQQRFDELAKLIARSASRRRLLKGGIAALAAGLFGTVALDESAEAAPSKNCRNKPNGTLCGGCGRCSAGACVSTGLCPDRCKVCDPKSLTCRANKCGECGVCDPSNGKCTANQSVCGVCERCNEVTTECVALNNSDLVTCGTCGLCANGRCDNIPSACGDDCGKCKKTGSGKKATYNCKSRCKEGQKCCPEGKCVANDRCCEDEQQCADGHCCLKDKVCTASGGCCPEGPKVCGNGIDAICCQDGTECASNDFARRCCPVGETVLCVETCCKDGSICCGGKCCQGTCSIGNVCCPTGPGGSRLSAQADVCCPFGAPCGSDGNEKCCAEGETCLPSGDFSPVLLCCPEVKQCGPEGFKRCCGAGQSCCGEICCDNAELCCPNQEVVGACYAQAAAHTCCGNNTACGTGAENCCLTYLVPGGGQCFPGECPDGFYPQ